MVGMRVLPAAVVVFVALAASACGSSGGTGTFIPRPPTTKTSQVTVRLSTALANLPPAVRTAVARELRAAKHPTKHARVDGIDVYGPGSRRALNAASGGGWVAVTPAESKARYYLTVLRGRFVCVSCSHPAGVSDPRGRVETSVWSPTAPEGDFGLMQRVPHAVSRLHRLIRIRIVRSAFL